MKKIILIFAVVCSVSTAFSQVPTNSNAIMLQAFHWDSNGETSWSQLYQISGDLSGYFDYVWLPPSAYSSGGTGYHPKQLSNQDSDWGTKDKQKRLIKALNSNNCKAIADIVVNHRDNKSTWCDFYPDDFGSYGKFQFDASHICKDDEVNNPDPKDNPGACKGKATGAYDTGEQYRAARDLDHTNTTVRNAVKAYLKWMKNEMSYSGWRYDVAKGFSASYFGEYNDAAGAEISVGEYFDGNYDALWNWVKGTGYKSMAFDFAFKFSALNNGLAQGNYGNMAWWDGSSSKNRPAGFVHSPNSRRYALTFIENHDTEYVRCPDGAKDCDQKHYRGDILKAHAFMLSSPGIPCIFYPHWKNNKENIQKMMKARKAVGLHSESDVQVQNTSDYYKAYSIGTYGQMITYIGNNNSLWSGDAPSGSGWTLNCSGNGWAMYTKIDNTKGQSDYQTKIDKGQNPVPDPPFNKITISAKVPAAWTAPKIHVWAVGGNQITTPKWPGESMVKVVGNEFTISLTGFSATEVGIVINDGATTAQKQTIDLFADGDVCFEVEATPTGIDGKYKAEKTNTCQSVAIDEIETGKVSIYPNPVDNILKIYAENEISKVTIYSISGQKVMVSDENAIDVSALTAGTYLIKIEFINSQFVFERFLKK